MAKELNEYKTGKLLDNINRLYSCVINNRKSLAAKELIKLVILMGRYSFPIKQDITLPRNPDFNIFKK